MRTPRVGSVQRQGPVQDLAVAYTRVSTEEQAREGVSLAAQEERARAYCVMAGLKIEKVLREEGVSGVKPLFRRPIGAELTAIARTSGVRNIVALKLDRLFRSALDALRVTEEWDRQGIALHIIDMGGQTLSTKSAMGRMMLTMIAGFAEFERNLIAERTAAALQHMKRAGKVYGAVPYGCTEDSGRLVADSGELATLEQIAGLRRGGMTLRAIAEQLNLASTVCKRGGRKWYASTVRSVLHQLDGERAAA